MMIDLNKITLGAAAGALTNLVIGGIGARLAMRAVALLSGGEPSASWEGTLGILLLGGMLGVVLGAAVACLHGVARERWRAADAALGGLLAFLAAALLFSIRDGEAALLPAWQAVLLFAPLALLSTLATGRVYRRLEQAQSGRTPRPTPAFFLVAYAAAFLSAFMGMMSLAGGSLRLPRVVWHMAQLFGTGADFAAAYAPMQMLGLGFALAYLLLAWLLFWLADRRDLQAAAIGCLLLAAGLFHVSGPIEAVAGRGPAADVGEALLALIGATILAVVYWRLLWGFSPGVRRAPLVISLLLVAGAMGGIAMVMTLQPAWRVLNQPPLVTLFSVALYLLPWLALPLGLLLSMRREPMPVASAPPAPAAALAEPS